MDHIDSRLNGRESCAFSATSLEQEQPGVLDGELHVLHVGVVSFEIVSQFH